MWPSRARPDLILLDIQHATEGLVTRYAVILRERAVHGRTKVIMLTAKGPDPGKEEGA